MASLQKEREEFLLAMAREGVPAEVARKVMRHAATVQRLAVDACNRELTRREILRDESAMARILALLAPFDVMADFQGDPRGACVKLKLKTHRGNSFGGEGLYCVPTPNY